MASVLTNSPASTDDQVRPDGRRERSADSRRRILASMVELIESGLAAPTAELIAAKANVSLRTVFRHFEEMENLYLEIAELVFDKFKPYLETPILIRTWPEVLDQIIERRATFFEEIAPYKTAIDAYRHRSSAISGQHRRIALMSRDMLITTLPPAVIADADAFELLNLLFSIETWQRLRDQQGLSPAQSRDVLRRGATAIAANISV